jgi:hypothetical protein
MNDEAAMTAFARLAKVSQQKQQFSQRDKFLLLTGIAACHAACVDVAARCREIVLANNPQHLIRKYESLPDALRSEDFEAFHSQLDRFCTFEKAEHLLDEFDAGGAVGESAIRTVEQLRESLNSTGWETS